MAEPKTPSGWSDAFFSYVPAEQAFSAGALKGAKHQAKLMREAAEQFREVNTNCPYPVEWLVQNFLERV